VLLLATACAEAPGTRAESPACSGACRRGAALEIENHVAWPFELSELVVSVADEALPTDLPSSEKRVARDLPLRLGHRYELQVAAKFAAPSSGDEDACVVWVRVSRGIEVDALPATIRANAYLLGPTVPFGERPAVAMTLENVRRLPEPWHPTLFDDAACRALETVERAVCRANEAVSGAERSRDPVRKLCSLDIGQKIGDLAVRIDALRVARVQGADPEAQGNAEREAVLVRELESLSAKLEECAPDVVVTRMDSRESTPECSAELEIPWDEKR